jgi:hypothetical protein
MDQPLFNRAYPHAPPRSKLGAVINNLCGSSSYFETVAKQPKKLNILLTHNTLASAIEAELFCKRNHLAATLAMSA